MKKASITEKIPPGLRFAHGEAGRGVAALIGFLLGSLLIPTSLRAQKSGDYFTLSGTDKSFAEIMKNGDIETGRNTTKGIKGSRVRVNQELLRDGPNAKRKIPGDIFIHTLGNSLIRRSDFSKWSRWYQEDGNTQIFRLFEGETNVRNSRPFAARIEAFSNVGWQEGDWHEWVGTYTILKPHRTAIFQAKNNVNDWSVQLNMNDRGDITLDRRVGADEIIAENMVGKPFHIRVRDNGLDYEVFLNGKKVGDGSYARPKGKTNFRWGLYRGGRKMTHDAMILVTGAGIDPKHVDESGLSNPNEPTGEGSEVMDSIKKREPEVVSDPEGLAIPERCWTNKEGVKVIAPGVYDVGQKFVFLKVGEEWVEYALDDLSESDRAGLLQALDFVDP